ncbi:pyocin knob domain-containing protein [Acinetobacter haemolyticus]|uniref:pyocin knob domain-containing protein n=1 Tax=Acinetobacter haemolyticus TaxID=29430 RepID=UPI003EF8CEAA
MATNWNAILSNANSLADILMILRKVLAGLDGKADITLIDEALDDIGNLKVDVDAAIEIINQAVLDFENTGGYITAANLAELNTITPSYDFQLARVEETGDEYRWDPAATPSPAWVPTGKNWLNAAKDYADANPNFKILNLTATDSLDIRYEGHFNVPSSTIATALGAPENKAGVMIVVGKGGTLNRTYRIFNSDKEYFSYSNGGSSTSTNFAWSAFELKVRKQDISTAKTEAITEAVNQSTAYTDGTTYQDKGRLTTEHLDALLSRGIWVSNTAANATIANGYPWEGVPCVITNKKTSVTPTLLQVAESIEATKKRTATRRHNGTSWGQWNTAEIVQFAQLDADVKNKVAPKGTWLYIDDTVCTFDKATRILSWNKTITLATRNVTQNRVNFSAGSINLSTAPDYTIIYLDLTLLPTDGSTVTNPASCIKFGNYNQFVDDVTKLPIAVMRSATGNVVSKNGFMPVVNSGSGGTSSSDGSSTIEFNKTATALEFYVKGGGANMIKHQLVHAVMPDNQLDNWGMTTAMEVNSSKANVKAITSNGVWECALKDSANASDHSGGSHGDELKTSAFFLVDGVYKAEDFVLSGKAKEIKFVQKSVIYAEASAIKIADRQVEWTFTAEKLNMKQTVTPVAGRTFTSTWVLMLPVLRKSNTNNTGIQITDKEVRSNDWTVIDVSEPEFERREMIARDGDQIILSGQSSGISASVKINKIDAPNPMHFIQNNIQFNKIYVSARTINTSALIAENEKWVIDADIVISTIN